MVSIVLSFVFYVLPVSCFYQDIHRATLEVLYANNPKRRSLSISKFRQLFEQKLPFIPLPGDDSSGNHVLYNILSKKATEQVYDGDTSTNNSLRAKGNGKNSDSDSKKGRKKGIDHAIKGDAGSRVDLGRFADVISTPGWDDEEVEENGNDEEDHFKNDMIEFRSDNEDISTMTGMTKMGNDNDRSDNDRRFTLLRAILSEAKYITSDREEGNKHRIFWTTITTPENFSIGHTPSQSSYNTKNYGEESHHYIIGDKYYEHYYKGEKNEVGWKTFKELSREVSKIERSISSNPLVNAITGGRTIVGGIHRGESAALDINKEAVMGSTTGSSSSSVVVGSTVAGSFLISHHAHSFIHTFKESNEEKNEVIFKDSSNGIRPGDRQRMKEENAAEKKKCAITLPEPYPWWSTQVRDMIPIGEVYIELGNEVEFEVHLLHTEEEVYLCAKRKIDPPEAEKQSRPPRWIANCDAHRGTHLVIHVVNGLPPGNGNGYGKNVLNTILSVCEVKIFPKYVRHSPLFLAANLAFQEMIYMRDVSQDIIDQVLVVPNIIGNYNLVIHNNKLPQFRVLYREVGMAALKRLLEEILERGTIEDEKNRNSSENSDMMTSSWNTVHVLEDLYQSLRSSINLTGPFNGKFASSILKLRADIYQAIAFSKTCYSMMIKEEEEEDKVENADSLSSQKNAAASKEIDFYSSGGDEKDSDLMMRISSDPYYNGRRICCMDSILGSAHGCVSTSLALYKNSNLDNPEEGNDLEGVMANQEGVGTSNALYEKAIDLNLASWQSYFATCEIFLPFLKLNSGETGVTLSTYSTSLYWDSHEQPIRDIVDLMTRNRHLLEQDLKTLLLDPLGLLSGLLMEVEVLGNMEMNFIKDDDDKKTLSKNEESLSKNWKDQEDEKNGFTREIKELWSQDKYEKNNGVKKNLNKKSPSNVNPFHQVTATKSGAWIKFVLYNGSDGWNKGFCAGMNGGRRIGSSSSINSISPSQSLNICKLLSKLPAEHLRDYYFLSSNEEVSLQMFLPNTRVGIHNGGSNTRINIDLMLSHPTDKNTRKFVETHVSRNKKMSLFNRKFENLSEVYETSTSSTTKAVVDEKKLSVIDQEAKKLREEMKQRNEGGKKGRPTTPSATRIVNSKGNSADMPMSPSKLLLHLGSPHDRKNLRVIEEGQILVYDDCSDAEIQTIGNQPVFKLQVGIMHPKLIQELEKKREEL